MHDLAQSWCQMWNDDAGLAHKLVSGDFRMWCGGTANGDPVRGAGDLAQFVGRYQREQGVRFTPRVVVADGQAQRLAYTWDAAFPDGSVVGGIDVYTLRDGLISENWSLAGERAASIPDDHSHTDGPGPASRADIDELCRAWSPMWNGGTARTADIVNDDFRAWFGARRSAADDLVGPAELAAYVRRHRDGHDSLRFAKHRDPVIDVARQRAAFTWTATLPLADGEHRTLGGIDLFQITGRKLSRCWSVTGTRPFTF